MNSLNQQAYGRYTEEERSGHFFEEHEYLRKIYDFRRKLDENRNTEFLNPDNCSELDLVEKLFQELQIIHSLKPHTDSPENLNLYASKFITIVSFLISKGTKNFTFYLNMQTQQWVYDELKKVVNEQQNALSDIACSALDYIYLTFVLFKEVPVPLKTRVWEENYSVPLLRGVLRSIANLPLDGWINLPPLTMLDCYLMKYDTPNLDTWVHENPDKWRETVEQVLEQKSYPVTGKHLPLSWLMEIAESLRN